MSINRLLIISRGEIAVRTVRAARDLGITSIVAHSDADADSLAVDLADEVVCLGPAHARKSYLNHDAVLAAAAKTHADAVHPGYGFLSENAEFARKVVDAGLTWVGPDPDTIARMGDKARAIATAREAGVPVVPGSNGLVPDADAAVQVAQSIGYPVLIKAAAGGGGRGIRIAHDAGTLRTGVAEASREAEAAFGNGGVYLERFVEHARHIEVQVLGDGTDAVHFFERDCSLQRRRQKLWEEAPAVVLDDNTRSELVASAVALTKHVGYRGAGTVEYLYDPTTREFFFIEMNTRIQVEHPITEEICGVDLIAAMLAIAAGDPLPWSQEHIGHRGHAIEVRINAEDPGRGFLPSPGRVDAVTWPQGPGVRVDTMVRPGSSIPPFYDSLIGKLIVSGADRRQALARLDRALSEVDIEGPATTVEYLRELLAHPDVQAGDVHTTWLESEFSPEGARA